MKAYKIGLVVACAAMVAACGGGGDAGTPSVGTVVSVPLITSPVAPAAGVDTEAVSAFNLLNSEAARCGFGNKNWSSNLAVAATGHADWQLLNGVAGHVQTTGSAGFTGVNFSDRYVAAGYMGAFEGTDENTSVLGTNAKSGEGARGIRKLLAAPYHAFGLLAGYTDVGIAVRNITDAGSALSPRVVVQVNPAYKTATGAQVPPSNVSVRTYPCNGTTGTAYEIRNETPNPVPGRNLSTNPIGHPILVETPIRNGVLVVTAASVTPVGGTAIALLPFLTNGSDTNGIIQTNQVALIPNLPLSTSTSYAVSISGSVNGTSFTQNFTFTTGS